MAVKTALVMIANAAFLALALRWLWTHRASRRRQAKLARHIHVIEIRDCVGVLVERPRAEWSWSIDGEKWWSGLALGDHVYVDGELAFIAESPEARLTNLKAGDMGMG